MTTPTQRFGFTLFARDQASPAFNQVGQAAGQLNAKMAAAAAAIGVSFAGLGALVSESFTAAFEQMDVKAKLQAQLGTTDAVAKKQGEIAGSLYSHGIAESFQQAADAIKTTAQSGLVPPDATNKQLESITKKALDIANVFEQDMPRVTNAAAQMIRTGLVKNTEEAFDVLTRGFQTGANKADDLLDTVNEYGTQFRKAGLDGAEAMGLISQAIQAGARDSDIAADAIKEFSIRAVDGSKSTAEGFKALELNAEDMARKFAEGGSTANAVLDLTLDKLRGVEDPVKRSQIAVQLFGTQAEDLGDALFAMDPSKAVDTLGKVGGAAEKMGKTIHSGPRHQIEVFKRTVEQNLVNFFGNTVIPAVGDFTKVLQDIVPVDRIKEQFGAAKQAASDFMAGLKGEGTVSFRADNTPIQVPKSRAAEIGAQIRDAISGGISGINWGEIGGTIGDGLASALKNAGKAAVKLTSAFGALLGKIDWVGIGIALGKFVPSLLVGLVVGLFNFDFAGLLKGLGEHWQEVLLAVLFVAFLPAKWLGAIGSALAKIPFLGKLLSWGLGIFTRFSKWLTGWAGRLLAGFGRGITQGLSRLFPSASRSVGEWAGRLALAIVGYAGRLGEAAIRMIRGIGPGLVSGAEGLGRFTVRAIEMIVRGFAGAGQWLFSHGRSVINGLLAGAATVLTGIGGWLKDHVVDPIVNGVKSLFGIKSPSTVFAGIGQNIIAGLKAGVVGAAKAIGAWVKVTVVDPVTSRFSAAGTWLLTKGRAFVTGFKNGVVEIAKTIGSWISRNVITPVTSRFSGAGSWLVGRGRALVSGFKSGVSAIAVSIGTWVARNFISPVTSRFTRAGSWLTKRGSQLVSGLKDGIVSGVKGIGAWLKRNLIDPIVSSVKKFFGIKSPSTVFAGIGKHLVSGLMRGLASTSGTAIARKVFGDMPSALGAIVGKGLVSISSLPGKAMDALGKLGGKFLDLIGLGGGGGGGVSKWTPYVRTVLKMLGAPAYALGPVLQRIKMESGGNPKAINLWDINAKNGTPSKGLMQTIGPTFNAYAGPFKGRGIYDPLANIYAGVNYAMNRYGSNWIRVMTRPGGYDQGGIARGIGYMPKYTIEPERVLSPRQTAAFDRFVDHLDQGVIGGFDVHVNVREERLRDFIDVVVKPKIRAAQDEAAFRQRVGRRVGGR